ncbi:terpene synthase family protein [Belliella sp. R4-6]|uniref:Terpene synthase n=1 Tax=Belliella alkalica TaxID=1730871 RepID=A0ABS9VGI8_9BACT|nr:terpene synthase family protein [Belliella alkalica]MCH7415284.1 terpene synthase family protein [Belliella alkalica]
MVLISQKHYKDAYALLNRYFNGFFRILNPDQLAQLFKVDKRTISRHNKYLHQIKESPVAKVKMGEILNYDFFSSLHLEAGLITNKVVAWLKSHQLLESPRQIRNFRENKMTYLAARLYPEASLQKSIWIGKLYAWLFLMDDYADRLPKGQKLKFWAVMEESVGNIMDPFYQAYLVNENIFIRGFEILWKDFAMLKSEWYRDTLKSEIEQYMVANLWEAKNRDFDKIPPLEEYLNKRPYFSGGRLALELIPLCIHGKPEEIQYAWGMLEAPRKLAAELIFISNDILSYQKEAEISDFHNWVALLMENQKMDKDGAMQTLLLRHDKVLRTFESKIRLYTANYKPEDSLNLSMIKNLKFQVSGAVTWSVEDTKRYLPKEKLANTIARIEKSFKY